jgi:hypothetical protein
MSSWRALRPKTPFFASSATALATQKPESFAKVPIMFSQPKQKQDQIFSTTKIVKLVGKEGRSAEMVFDLTNSMACLTDRY